jgi:DNA-binding transcriptional LysR family regulator
MDRIDAMTAFVTVADAGGFSAAARKLGYSPASITRAIAFLERRIGTALLRRTTRLVKLTESGERYLVSCRRILSDVAEAEALDAERRARPHGLLTVTAPLVFGRVHVRAIVDAYLAAHGDVRARLLLLDRVVSLVDEGIDVAIRIGHMPDSALIATTVGEVARIVCASPAYLARRATPREPSDLSAHDCISFSQVTPHDTWTFKGAAERRQVKVKPRLVVNTAGAAIDSALDGHGITRVLSYQIEHELGEGRLVRLLAAWEPPPIPVYVVYPAVSAASAKVRAFVDAAAPRLRAALAALASNATKPRAVKRARRGR